MKPPQDKPSKFYYQIPDRIISHTTAEQQSIDDILLACDEQRLSIKEANLQLQALLKTPDAVVVQRQDSKPPPSSLNKKHRPSSR